MNLLKGFHKVMHVEGLVQNLAGNKCLMYVGWMNE